MKTSEQTRISQFIESQIDIANSNHKIKVINLQQDRLNIAFWFTLAAFLAVGLVICL